MWIKPRAQAKGCEKQKSRGLAILLYGDWIPQANGSPTILKIYGRGSLFQVPT